jgi:hypothetical protein
MIVLPQVVAAGTAVVSITSVVPLYRERGASMDAYLRVRAGLLAFLAVSALLVLAIFSHLAWISIPEWTLLWALPGFAAWDAARREVPVAALAVVFVLATFVHVMLFQDVWPFVFLGIGAVFVAFYPSDFLPLGDKLFIAWLWFAFGDLGVLASLVAVATCARRDRAPFVTHASIAAAVLLLPLALLSAHAIGRPPWRF